MNFQHVRAFHAVAKHRSVVRAARALGVSQPTLSQQIKSLESRHQARLFERTGRSLALTALGAELFAATGRLMTCVDEVETVLNEAGGMALGGRLQVGTDGPQHAAAILAEFRKKHPAPKITLVVANALQTMHNLIEGKVDVAIVANPPGEPGIVFQPIGFDPLHVVAPVHHRFAKLAEVPLNELASEILLLREPQSRTRALVEQILAEAGIEPRETMELGPREAIREAIARDMGVGVFVSMECGSDSRLTSRPLATSRKQAGLTEYVVCKQDRRHQGVIRAFLNIARTYSETWRGGTSGGDPGQTSQ
ncbi:MAG: LysR substrate-binding domain-containing protein [Hyphomicrobiales bacterium]|nr:LysR substrate-binding domain-containing protein [Hyphomicrobiales bacterium]